MARYKRSADLDVAKLKQLYVTDGLSIRRVARAVNSNFSTTRAVLTKAGVKLRPPRRGRPVGPEEQALMKKRYESGTTLATLAGELGVSHSYMAKIYRSWGGVPRGRTEAAAMRRKLAQEGG